MRAHVRACVCACVRRRGKEEGVGKHGWVERQKARKHPRFCKMQPSCVERAGSFVVVSSYGFIAKLRCRACTKARRR
eukprot:49934-Pleurochrysis_carterae.AAC.1